MFFRSMTKIAPVHIIGGGLAGSEAAWQIARAGVPVILHDARSRGAEAYIALAKEFLARRHAVVA